MTVSRIRNHFTLTELLIVIAIIMILTAMLLPALSKARETALASDCMNRMKTIGQAAGFYLTDFDDTFIRFEKLNGENATVKNGSYHNGAWRDYASGTGTNIRWHSFLTLHYLGKQGLTMHCPARPVLVDYAFNYNQSRLDYGLANGWNRGGVANNAISTLKQKIGTIRNTSKFLAFAESSYNPGTSMRTNEVNITTTASNYYTFEGRHPLSFYHQNLINVSLADGHVERMDRAKILGQDISFFAR